MRALMDQESSIASQRVSQNPAGDNSVNSSDSETVIQIRENEIADSNSKTNGSTSLNKAVVPEGEANKAEEGEDKLPSCVIDVKESVGENQRVCRICHLSAKESGQSSMELMELGCGCKGELGVAHLDCAEAWFRVKGNRVCEICGQTANNVTGVRDNGFLEDWNEMGPAADSRTNSSLDGQRCLGRHPLCNFLMACLVVAFILPWFLRISIF